MAKIHNLIPPGLLIEGDLAVSGSLTITGKFTGNLAVLDDLSVTSEAKVTAGIQAGSLQIEPGAIVRGQVRVAGGQSLPQAKPGFFEFLMDRKKK